MDSRQQGNVDENNSIRWQAFNSIEWIHNHSQSLKTERPPNELSIPLNGFIMGDLAFYRRMYVRLSIPLNGFFGGGRWFGNGLRTRPFQFHWMDSWNNTSDISILEGYFQFHWMDSFLNPLLGPTSRSLPGFQFHWMDSASSRPIFTVESSLISTTWILFH